MDTARELARRTNAGPISRPEPLRARWELGPFNTRDKHTVRVVFQTGLQVGQNPGDLELFAEHFLVGRPTAQLDDVELHLRPSLEQAARAAVADLDVGEILSPSASAPLSAKLAEALKAPTFAVGLVIKPPHHLIAHSESWQQQQRREQAAAMQEAELADRKQRLEREKELLAAFKRMRDELPDVPAGELLARLAPADREATLRATLLQDDRPANTLHAVGGTSLLSVSLDRDLAPVLTRLPETLGPARSCSPAGGDGRLAIGMRGGVLLLNPSKPDEIMSLVGPQHSAQTGYNSASLDASGTHLAATHSEVGLVVWSLDRPNDARAVACPAARSAVALPGGGWLFSGGSRVLRWKDGVLSTIAEAGSTVLCVAIDHARALAVCADGSFFRILLPELRVERGSFGRQLVAASAVPWLGSLRALIAGTDGSVELAGDFDGLFTRLLGNTRGALQVEGAPGTASAVSSDRTHATVWRLWNPAEPCAELSIFSSLRHRIADVLLTV
jgi:hypothetical protein